MILGIFRGSQVRHRWWGRVPRWGSLVLVVVLLFVFSGGGGRGGGLLEGWGWVRFVRVLVGGGFGRGRSTPPSAPVLTSSWLQIFQLDYLNSTPQTNSGYCRNRAVWKPTIEPARLPSLGRFLGRRRSQQSAWPYFDSHSTLQGPAFTDNPKSIQLTSSSEMPTTSISSPIQHFPSVLSTV